MIIVDIFDLLKSEKKSIILGVINLSSEFCQSIKEARRAAGLSQSLVAREVGCKQSALSMFEQGDGTKLNDEVITKLAKKFGVELPTTSTLSEATVFSSPINQNLAGEGFCPNPHCPSNHAYQVEGRRLLRPNRQEADPVGAKYCALCGEILEKCCPNCGALLHEGAICSYCGQPYVAVSE